MLVGNSLIRLGFIGSPGRARTADLVINSHPLYQLSYRGIGERMLIVARGAVNKRAVHEAGRSPAGAVPSVTM